MSYLDQNTDIPVPTETTQPNVDTVDNTAKMPSETPSMTAQMENFMNEQKMNRPYRGNAEVSNADFYPTHNEPVQQGGGMFTTIAPTASLFPFAAVAKMQDENNRINSVLSAKQKAANEWNFKLSSIDQPEINSKFTDLYTNLYNQTKSEQQTIWGNDWVSHVKNDPSIMSRFTKLNDIAKSFNEDLALATSVEDQKKENPFYIDDRTKKRSEELRGAYDNIMSGTSEDPKDIDKWWKIIKDNRQELLKQKDVPTELKAADDLAKVGLSKVEENLKDYKNQYGNIANDALQNIIHESPFLKVNNKGEVEFNEQGADNFLMDWRKTATGNEYEKDNDGNYIKKDGKYVLKNGSDDRYIDPETWIRMGKAGIENSMTSTIQTMNNDYVAIHKENREANKEKAVTVYGGQKTENVPINNGKDKINATVTEVNNDKNNFFTKESVVGVTQDGKPALIPSDTKMAATTILSNISPSHLKKLGLNPNASSTVAKEVYLNPVYVKEMDDYNAKLNDAKNAKNAGQAFTVPTVPTSPKKITVFTQQTSHIRLAANSAHVAVQGLNYSKEKNNNFEYYGDPNDPTKAIPNPDFNVELKQYPTNQDVFKPNGNTAIKTHKKTIIEERKQPNSKTVDYRKKYNY